MDAIKRAFLEDPLYVYAALGIAAFVLAAAWYERRRRLWLNLAACAVLLGVGVGLVEHLVVTDRERIVAALHEIAKAVETRQLDRAAEYVDEDYGGWKLTRKALIAAGKLAVRTYDIREVRFVGQPTVDLRGAAGADCRVRTVVHRGEAGRPVPLSWELEWIKRPGGWRIRRARPSFDPMP